ncbi:uncharacterized protein EV154DRAFT_556065 [Mucor mucedo]|uniref:uncharacterized protein n=1 Tax=Mucor mucedo TaxID=29922 RepID=UPI00221EB6F3|nr:uncharacterized protein EV154DRAFT_556065 [Mucor mucedo]KAI7874184.1 hypothetical protein EV154DRAFT_556065 [Mucor mucedo]
MPSMSLNLGKTRAVELLRGRSDFKAPRLRLNGIITAKSTDAKNKVFYNVVLNELPDTIFVLHRTYLKYEGVIVKQGTIDNSSYTDTTVNTNTLEEDVNLEDAEPSDEDEEEIPVCDEVWDTREVHTNARLSSGNNYRSIEAVFNLQNKAIVPSISTHAHSVKNCRHVDKKAYWWMGNSHLRPNINFGEFMEYGLLVSVLQYHVFEVNCGNWLASNPFYQIGMSLQKSNVVLARALEPG